VPHKFLLKMFITYLMYMFVTIIKVNWDVEKRCVTFKKYFDCFNFSFKITIRKLILLCC